MSRTSRATALLLGLAGLMSPQAAPAHAALLEAEATQAIRLHAFYDTGAPMAGAQVIIFAPDNPAQPWGRGRTDDEGRFVFVPDGQEGRWSVQVRQAGHGAMAHVDPDGAAPVVLAAGGTGSWLDRAVMVILVGWGALGTALFAMRHRGRPHASS